MLDGWQPRGGWKDRRDNFYARIESAWFVYFEWLGLTPKMVSPIRIDDRCYRPSFWIEEWSCFVFVTEHRSANLQARALFAEAEELSKRLGAFDVLVMIGMPASADSGVRLYSRPFADFLNSWNCKITTHRNSWSLTGIIDLKDSTAYYWLLVDGYHFGYLPGNRSWFESCNCNKGDCALCIRFEGFSPIEVAGTPFLEDFPRHMQGNLKCLKRSCQTPASRYRHGDCLEDLAF